MTFMVEPRLGEKSRNYRIQNIHCQLPFNCKLLF